MLSQAPRAALYEGLERGTLASQAVTRALIDGSRGPDLARETASYDVVIIGAGPAGSTFAASLRAARPGARILVVDRDHVGSHIFGNHGDFYSMTTASLPGSDENRIPGSPLQVSDFAPSQTPPPEHMNLAGLAALDHSGADVLWDHEVVAVNDDRGDHRYDLRFRNGTSARAHVVVMATGQGPLNLDFFDEGTRLRLRAALAVHTPGLMTFDDLATQAIADRRAGTDPRARYQGRKVVVLGRGVVSGKAAAFFGIQPTTTHTVESLPAGGFLINGAEADVVVLAVGAERDQTNLFSRLTGDGSGGLVPVFGVAAQRPSQIIAKRWVKSEGAESAFFALDVAAGWDQGDGTSLQDMLPRAEALAGEVAAHLSLVHNEISTVDAPREAELQAVLGRLSSEGKSSDHPRIIFFAGIPGSGKSTEIRRRFSDGTLNVEDFVLVDPDRIRGMLTSYHRAQVLDSAAAGQLVHRAATGLQFPLIMGLLAAQKNIIVDGTLRDTDFIWGVFHRIRHKYPHYRISLYVMDCDPAVAAQRITARAASTGRVLPEQDLGAFRDRIQASVARLTPLVHEVVSVRGGH